MNRRLFSNASAVRRGFTIIEMMMVVAVISLLLTLVFTAVGNAMSDARSRRAAALCQTVQAGLAAYHAQYDKWPGSLGGYVESDSIPDRSNQEADGGDSSDSDKLVLNASEVREMVKALVDEAKQGNPLMDISALFVSRDPGESGSTGYGLDFMSAVRGTSRSRKKMSTSEMYFGYPESSKGYFRRFKMVYSVPNDSLTVSTQ